MQDLFPNVGITHFLIIGVRFKCTPQYATLSMSMSKYYAVSGFVFISFILNYQFEVLPQNCIRSIINTFSSQQRSVKRTVWCYDIHLKLINYSRSSVKMLLILLLFCFANPIFSYRINNITFEANDVIEEESIWKGATHAVVTFDRKFDEYIQWSSLDAIFDDITDASGQFNLGGVGEIRRLFLGSADHYYDSTTAIYEWCGVSTTLLKIYLELFSSYEKDKEEAQAEIIVAVLDEGLKRMEESIEHLDESRNLLNKGIGDLTNLIGNISVVFQDKEEKYEQRLLDLKRTGIESFKGGLIAGIVGLIMTSNDAGELKQNFEGVKDTFTRLRDKISTAIDKGIEIKKKLQDEKTNIVDIRAQTTATKITLTMKRRIIAVVKRAANELITKCEAYQKKHGYKP